jgi:predicted DNA-binding transcriptional regulator AlpA
MHIHIVKFLDFESQTLQFAMSPNTLKHIKISELSRFLGISAQTIRNYERDATFPSPTITDKGYRLYSEEDATKLKAYFLPAKHRRKPKE